QARTFTAHRERLVLTTSVDGAAVTLAAAAASATATAAASATAAAAATATAAASATAAAAATAAASATPAAALLAADRHALGPKLASARRVLHGRVADVVTPRLRDRARAGDRRPCAALAHRPAPSA